MAKNGSSAPPPGREAAPRTSRKSARDAGSPPDAEATPKRARISTDLFAPDTSIAPQSFAAVAEDFSYDDEDDDGADPLYAGGPEEIARYISEMVGSLAMMAREARLDLLTYLLDMTRVEAEMQARQTEIPLDEL